jgi:hypothetical protein
MAEQSTDIVAEKIERNDIRRNTSNQIISYTLPDNSAKLYGILRIPGQRTAFNPSEFSKVVYSKPSELVNPIPEFTINIVSQTKINTNQLITSADELNTTVGDYIASPSTLVSQFRPISFGSTAMG